MIVLINNVRRSRAACSSVAVWLRSNSTCSLDQTRTALSMAWSPVLFVRNVRLQLPRMRYKGGFVVSSSRKHILLLSLSDQQRAVSCHHSSIRRPTRAMLHILIFLACATYTLGIASCDTRTLNTCDHIERCCSRLLHSRLVGYRPTALSVATSAGFCAVCENEVDINEPCATEGEQATHREQR